MANDDRENRPAAEYYDESDGINKCPSCDQANFKCLHRVDHFGFPIEFFQCQCGLIKQVPMPNEGFFEWFFNSELFVSSKRTQTDEIWGFFDYLRDESSRLKTSRRRFRILSRALQWDGRKSMMKVGPSTGTFLHAAKTGGHDARGCDVSNEFVEYAKSTYGVSIDQGRFEKMEYESEQFDALLLFNVIENIPNLLEFLQAVRRSLKIGGHFIYNHVEMERNIINIFQKDKYFMFRPPICYAFNHQVIDQIIEKLGFEKRKRFRDIRYLHLEKIFTLLRWKWPLRIAQTLKIDRINFPIWAYPSWVTIVERVR